MKSPRRITSCAVCPILFCALLFCGLFAPTLTAEEEVLQEWTFASSDSAAGWSGGNITQPTVVDGALTATFRASDPILISPIFDIKPAVGQYVEITARCVSAQAGELFYAADTSGIYGGFSQEKSTRWELINDGRTHTYKIYPQWAGLPQIIRIRIDFGAPTGDQIGKEGFALESVRIVDPHFDQLPECDGVWDFTDNCDWSAGSSVEKTPAGWRLTGNDEASVIASQLFRFRTGKKRPWLNLTLKGTAPRIQIGYATDISRSWASIGFDLTPSDKPIVYNIRLGDKNNWGSELVLLSLKLTRAGEATVERIQVSDSPQGPPRLEVCSALATEAINRCGTPTPIAVSIKNVGGEPAGDVRVQLTPPDGITAEGEALLGDALPFEPLERTFLLTCDHPFSGTIPYTVTAKDLPPISGSIDV